MSNNATELSPTAARPLVFFAGIIFLAIGIYGLTNANDFKENAVEVEATLHSNYVANEYYNHDTGEYKGTYKTYASYTYEGNEYEEYLESGKSSTSIGPITITKGKEGKKEKIYVNPDNPREIKGKSEVTAYYIFAGLGALACVASIFGKME